MLENEVIKELLSIKGVILEDSQVESLIDYVINIITSETGRYIKPQSKEDIELHFKGNEYNTRHYPIKTVETVYSDDTLILASDYFVDYESGIIHFINIPKTHVLKVNYTVQESEEFINTKIMPLVVDMIIQNMGSNEFMGMSSIHEGNTTVSFDSNLSFSASINRRLENLKRKGLTRML